MNFKEHLQFLAMMIPTFVLLVALAVSLAFPGDAPVLAEGLPPAEAASETD